jgi:hypothetical protein
MASTTVGSPYLVRNPEANNLAQLIKYKPPAKVDGLILFANDLSHHFSPRERRRMRESESGRVIFDCLTRCGDITKKLRTLREEWIQDMENNMRYQKLKVEENVYSECLAHFACPAKWKQYTQCWSSLANFNARQLANLQELGPESACSYERQVLEQCVGGLVSGAVRAAESTSIEMSVEEVGLDTNPRVLEFA